MNKIWHVYNPHSESTESHYWQWFVLAPSAEVARQKVERRFKAAPEFKRWTVERSSVKTTLNMLRAIEWVNLQKKGIVVYRW